MFIPVIRKKELQLADKRAKKLPGVLPIVSLLPDGLTNLSFEVQTKSL
jgi:hypothetical protein